MRWVSGVWGLLMALWSLPISVQAQAWEFVGPNEASVSGLYTLHDGTVLLSQNWMVYRSEDHGLTWVPVDSSLSLGELVEGPDGVVMGQSFSRVGVSFDAGRTWVRRGPESGNFVTGVGVGSDTTLYYTLSTSTSCRSTGCITSGGGLHASQDGGETWTEIAFSGQFAGHFVVDDEGNFFTTRGDQLAYSVDDGRTWVERRVVAGYGINDLVADGDGSVLIATVEGIATFDKASRTVLPWGSLRSRVSRLLVAASENVYALDTNAYRSTDGGITWEWLSLPQGCPDYCTLTETRNGHLLVGTPVGVYRSTNPVATNTEGTPGSPPGSEVVVSLSPNPVPAAATLAVTLAAPTTVQIDLFDVLGRMLQQVYDGPLPQGTHRVALDVHNLASGTYYCRVRDGDLVETIVFSVVR